MANLTTNTRGFTRPLQKAGSDLEGFASRALSYAALIGGAFGFTRIVGAASDVYETVNKFNVVFGENSEAVKRWSDDFADSIGRSRRLVAEFVSGNQDLFVPIGFDAASAEGLSKTVAQLAFDLASFNNLTDQQTFGDLQAALTGSGEVMKKYGVIVNETAVKQELLNQGINPKSATEAQKTYARLNIILRGTTSAQGDALRSMGGFANQWKRFQGIVENSAADIGAKVLPMVTQGVRYLASSVEQLAPLLGATAAAMAWIAGDGATAARVFVYTASAVLIAVSAYKAVTLATQAWARAQSFALALQGPKGWAILAGSLLAASAATSVLTEKFDGLNAETAAASSSSASLGSATAGTTAAMISQASAVDDLAEGIKKLKTAQLDLRSDVVKTREQVKAFGDDWRAAIEAGADAGMLYETMVATRTAFTERESGFTGVFGSLSDELAVLRGDITETEQKLAKMAAFGVDPRQIEALRQMFGERDKLLGEQAAKEEAAQLEAGNLQALESFATKVHDALLTPLDTFRAEVADVEAAVEAGLLSKSDAAAFIEKRRAELNKQLEDDAKKETPEAKRQALNSAIGANTDAANRVVADLLNRRGGQVESKSIEIQQQLLKEQRTANQIAEESKKALAKLVPVRTKPFGGAV